ncbi:MAG: hypothetical protein OXL41_05785 [Nitrospinae bacterium]|nr:hypothetical protein [Nitrospinota bacterium]
MLFGRLNTFSRLFLYALEFPETDKPENRYDNTEEGQDYGNDGQPAVDEVRPIIEQFTSEFVDDTLFFSLEIELPDLANEAAIIASSSSAGFSTFSEAGF